MQTSRRLLLTAVLLVAGLTFAGTAAASALVGRNATDVRLVVLRGGVADLSWTENGRRRHVRAWGAINARAPSRDVPQVRFNLDYGGRPATGGRCSRYDGPALQSLVAACRAPDGSYWAAQSWVRLVRAGTPSTAGVAELHLSHWRGPIADFVVKVDWAQRWYDDVYGWLTYQGEAVHGFKSRPSGAPLDTYGRNVYLDTLDSSYGNGWYRENGFLTHRYTGGFCYALYRGQGRAYRASVVGPGVTPDLFWQSRAPGPYDAARDVQANAEQQARIGKVCS